ncbi:MAG: hypothetical protein DRO13_06085 [Thermoprotei archaeon]|nr:MAG: hypothetical protein DRO13_06085 [Thermoprotei archaeon]
MPVITQVSKIRYRRQDGAFFIYLWREYKELWMKLREKKIPIIVRIEIPDDILKEDRKENNRQERHGGEKVVVFKGF